MNAPPGPIASRDRPTCSEWCPGGVRPGLHPQRPDPGSVKTWTLSRPARTPRPRIPSRLGEDLMHGDGKRAQCRSLPAPPGRSLAAPPAFSCGRGMRWDGPPHRCKAATPTEVGDRHSPSATSSPRRRPSDEGRRGRGLAPAPARGAWGERGRRVMARPRPDQALRAWAAAVERPMLACQARLGRRQGGHSSAESR